MCRRPGELFHVIDFISPFFYFTLSRRSQDIFHLQMEPMSRVLTDQLLAHFVLPVLVGSCLPMLPRAAPASPSIISPKVEATDVGQCEDPLNRLELFPSLSHPVPGLATLGLSASTAVTPHSSALFDHHRIAPRLALFLLTQVLFIHLYKHTLLS